MRKRLSLILALLMIFAFTLTGCGDKSKETPAAEGPTDEAVEINISAAASLTDALTEIQTEYAKQSNAALVFNFAGSGALVKQIQEGAPCDLFMSASEENMDTLEEAGLIASDSRMDLLGNVLTLIAAAEKADVVTAPESLLKADVGSIAIGTPDSVPAGKYAKTSLETLKIWDGIQSKLVYGKDVKEVLSYVETGNADCGLVYKSDSLQLKTGVVVCDMPEDSHEPIVYPVALIKDSSQQAAAAAFYEFLKSDYSAGVFEKYGFTVLH